MRASAKLPRMLTVRFAFFNLKRVCQKQDWWLFDASPPTPKEEKTMKNLLISTLAMLFILGGCVDGILTPQPQKSTIKVNLQVDAEKEDVDSLLKVTNELQKRGIETTVFVTGDFANKNATVVNDLFLAGFQIALHGYNTGEQLATMTYDEQKDLLTRAKQAVEGCFTCGTSQPVIGFRPQYFSQNEDTYKIVDELGLEYNCGFKAGQLYMEGHENDVAPYSADNYSFVAVPFSTFEHKGEPTYLCDIANALKFELTGEEWEAALKAKLDTAIEKDEPLVVLIHGWYTGNNKDYDYWQPFVNFLDYAESKNVEFVGTKELVDFYSD